MYNYFRHAGFTLVVVFIFAVVEATPTVTICQYNSGDTSLRLLLHFNQNVTTHLDESGYGNSCAITNASFSTSGKFGGACVFDGDGDYGVIADADSLDITSNLTITMWIKPSTAVGFDIPISKWIGSGDTQQAFQCYWSNDYLPNFALNPDDGTGEITLTAGTALNLNQWNYLVLRFNDTTNELAIFKNGIKDLNTAAFTKTPKAIAGNLELARNDQSSNYFNGTIDEVAIYARALSDTEIYNNYYRNPLCQAQ